MYIYIILYIVYLYGPGTIVPIYVYYIFICEPNVWIIGNPIKFNIPFDVGKNCYFYSKSTIVVCLKIVHTQMHYSGILSKRK